MKLLKYLASSLLILLATSSAALASGHYLEGWEYQSFNSKIQLYENGDAIITETIVADFTNEAHRGLERSIPSEYPEHTVGIHLLSATNENGHSYKTKTYNQDGHVFIQMIRPDDTPKNSIQVFILKYKATNIINFFDNQDELFWNVNGTEQPIPTNIASAIVQLPEHLEDRKDLKAKCYTGAYGSREQNCEYLEEAISFSTTAPLAAYEGLTIVLGLPKGIIIGPSPYEEFIRILKKTYGFGFPIIAFILMFTLWHRHGRDEKTFRDTIMPHYRPPKDMLPAETGTIIDEQLNPSDITATIIDYAIKGYIKIDELEKNDYQFTLKKPLPKLKKFESLILKQLFPKNTKNETKKLSELKNKFHKIVKSVEESIMSQLVKDDFFPKSPAKTRFKYAIIAAIPGVLILNTFELWPLHIGLGIFLAAIIVYLFGRIMPRKTQKGTETYYILKGLHEYINTAEKDRLEFQEKNGILFQKLLPYAIAFGLTKKWSTAFADIIKVPPVWYHGYGPDFNMNDFSRRLNKATKKMNTNITSRPGSRGNGAWSGSSGFSSGGFSGGGFGGGGGRGL